MTRDPFYSKNSIMNKILEKPIYCFIILTVLCGWLFFFRLGGLALTDPDETFYAQTAKEMVNRDEWVTPYLYDRPQFEKPILLYWLVEASFKIFGVNEFSARFPSAVFAFAGIIALYLLGALLFNRRVGLLSAVMMASSLEYIVLSRACVTDMVLSTFMLLGVLFFFYGYLKGKGHFYILSSASFALATLTKGPIAIILPAGVIFSYLLFTKNLKAVKRMPILWSVTVFVLVAAPWYLLMYKLHGASFTDAFFGFQNITRFLQSEHKMGSQFYYNIPVVFAGFVPWSVFLPFGIWHVFKKLRTPQLSTEKKHLLFIIIWFLAIFIFFSISRTKLPTYIFPSFISLALITAVLWDDFLKTDAPQGIVRGMKFSYYLLLSGIVGGAIGALIFIGYDYPGVLTSAFIAGLFVLFGMALSLAAFINKKFIWAFTFIAYSLVLFLYPLSELVLPAIEDFESCKGISRKLLTMMKPGERLGSESHYRAGLAFYTNKIPADTDTYDLVTNFLGSDDRVWCVLKEKNHRQLYELENKPYFYKPSYMVYRFDKKTIVTNKIPDDGKYMIKRERK